MKKIFSQVIALLLFVSCEMPHNGHDNQDEQSASNTLLDKSYYIPLLTELHSIECSFAGINQPFKGDSALYAFRAAAFHKLILEPDRRILARYEDLCQKIAAVEYAIEDGEKELYLQEKCKIYEKGCP